MINFWHIPGFIRVPSSKGTVSLRVVGLTESMVTVRVSTVEVQRPRDTGKSESTEKERWEVL